MKIILDEKQIEVKKKLAEISQQIIEREKISPQKKLKKFQNSKNQKTLKKFLAKIFTKIKLVWAKLTKIKLTQTNSAQTKTKKNIPSLYLYGSVGVGKSMLMNDFYQNLSPQIAKKYFHFNVFMRLIHENLHQIRSEEKSENKKYRHQLFEAIDRILADIEVLCFDEFQVFDIADASLLSRIFSYLFEKNVVVIFTSNSHPKNLYPNGIQREIFIKFVDEILLKNCQVFFLDGKKDYRKSYLKNIGQRYFVKNSFIYNSQNSREEFDNLIKQAVKSEKLIAKTLKVWGRDLVIEKTYQNIAIIDFIDLFQRDLAADDYQKICNSFDLIFLVNLPIISIDETAIAKRLILFIDEIYESKTALIIFAECEIEEIYPPDFQKKKNLTSFERTISRLHQIKSDYYWRNAKFNNVI